MRQYKFRAWDESLKEMVYPDTMYHNINLGITVEKAYSPTKGLYFPLQESITMMQSTEMLDVNKKEVYEGDILEIRIEDVLQHNYYIVEDIKDLYLECNRDDSYFRITSFRIIGNIYENPELLYDSLSHNRTN